ncbi:Asparaginase [Fusarium sp. LHS14.1]|nr:Asparaginase [Fusarium sp. LHS14.1]
MQPFSLFLAVIYWPACYHRRPPLDAKEPSHANVALPNITIIATGGTIAGAADSSARTTEYESGALGIDEITREIQDDWRNDAVVDYDQLMNVDSLSIDSSRAIKISQHVTEVANNPHVQGIVLLLGTDLLSEVAVFLALTVTTPKPIVMTGAILPHGAFGADGPGNILAAVRTAATKSWSSEGHEVVIVIQNKIMAPWGTKKENNEFKPGPRSLLGDIKDFRPFFRWLPGPCAPMKFDLGGLSPGTPLPEVVPFKAHQDFRAYQVEAAIANGAKGIVLVGYGDGYWPEASAQQIKKLADETDVVMVFAAEGQLEYVANARIGAGIPGGAWDPRQLIVFLRFLLWKGADEGTIRRAVLSSPGSCLPGGIERN